MDTIRLVAFQKQVQSYLVWRSALERKGMIRMYKFYKMMIEYFLGSGNSMRKVIEMGKSRSDITHPEIPLTWKRGEGPEWWDRH